MRYIFLSRYLRKVALTAMLLLGALATYLNADEQPSNVVAMPAPSVEVLEVQLESVRLWTHFSGRLSPVQSVSIKPLVGGTIDRVWFTDGQRVKAGDALFTIDPRPHQASVLRAKAQLATAQSRAVLAQDELNRTQRLVSEKLVSQSVYDTAFSNQQVTQAAVDEAKAALTQAQLNLEYATIRAPISGRMSRAELTQGNIVDGGQNAPVLATLVSNDQLYAEFNVDEASYVNLIRKATKPEAMPVELTLTSDASVVYRGHIAAFDNQLDSSSGTIRARALFDNSDGALTAGMYANIRVGSAMDQVLILMPERAIGTNQDKKFVLIVDETNTAQYREVTLAQSVNGKRVVSSGLKPGDKVIINGLSHVRPNMPVQPQLASTEELAAGR